jgi:hypothetical protein
VLNRFKRFIGRRWVKQAILVLCGVAGCSVVFGYFDYQRIKDNEEQVFGFDAPIRVRCSKMVIGPGYDIVRCGMAHEGCAQGLRFWFFPVRIATIGFVPERNQPEPLTAVPPRNDVVKPSN